MAESNLTAAEVAALLIYEPETGNLMWLPSVKGRATQGARAGTVATNGYIRIRIKGRCYAAHRVAYLVMTGAWPTHQIDHINRIRDDNRWENLRLATPSQNQRNKGRGDDEIGIYPATGGKRWKVMIRVGTYATKELAAIARRRAALALASMSS